MGLTTRARTWGSSPSGGGPSTTNNNYLRAASPPAAILASGHRARRPPLRCSGDRVRTRPHGLQGHTVVAGGGRRGLAFAESSRSRGKDVVVIDVEPTEHAAVSADVAACTSPVTPATPTCFRGGGCRPGPSPGGRQPDGRGSTPRSRCAGELSNSAGGRAALPVAHRRPRPRQAVAHPPGPPGLPVLGEARLLLPWRAAVRPRSCSGSRPSTKLTTRGRSGWSGADDLWDAFPGLISVADADLNAPPGRTTVVLIRPDARRGWRARPGSSALGAQLSLQAVDVEPGEVTGARRWARTDAVYVRHQEDDETRRRGARPRGPTCPRRFPSAPASRGRGPWPPRRHGRRRRPPGDGVADPQSLGCDGGIRDVDSRPWRGRSTVTTWPGGGPVARPRRHQPVDGPLGGAHPGSQAVQTSTSPGTSAASSTSLAASSCPDGSAAARGLRVRPRGRRPLPVEHDRWPGR